METLLGLVLLFLFFGLPSIIRNYTFDHRLITPKIDSGFVNKIFTCYDNTAKVSSKEYLNEEVYK